MTMPRIAAVLIATSVMAFAKSAYAIVLCNPVIPMQPGTPIPPSVKLSCEGAMDLSNLGISLKGNAISLNYHARVLMLAPVRQGPIGPPIGPDLEVEFYSGSTNLGTVQFGRWPNSCNDRDETRIGSGGSFNPASWSKVTSARIYFTGGNWSKC